jgi:membrane protease YdiL (CAAX protease family)
MKNLIRSFRDIIFVALIGIVAFAASGMLLGVVSIGNPDVRFIVSYSTPITLMLIGVAMYDWLACGRRQPTMLRLRGLSPLVHIWGLVLLMALAVVLMPLLSVLPQRAVEVPTGVWAVVTLIFVAPVLEELLFRAKVFSVMRYTCSPTLAAMVSAAIFAAMHGQVGVAIEAFCAGMIFSYAYILTGSIFAPIILHIFNNIIAFVLLQFMYQERSIEDYLQALPSFNIIYVISLVVLLLGVVHITLTYLRADRRVRNGEPLDIVAAGRLK